MDCAHSTFLDLNCRFKCARRHVRQSFLVACVIDVCVLKLVVRPTCDSNMGMMHDCWEVLCFGFDELI